MGNVADGEHTYRRLSSAPVWINASTRTIQEKPHLRISHAADGRHCHRQPTLQQGEHTYIRLSSAPVWINAPTRTSQEELHLRVSHAAQAAIAAAMIGRINTFSTANRFDLSQEAEIRDIHIILSQTLKAAL